MGEMMDGIKLNCNIYTFENAENYISRLELFNEKSGVCCHKVNEIIQEIKKSSLTLKDAKLILNTMLPEFMDALADFQKLPY